MSLFNPLGTGPAGPQGSVGSLAVSASGSIPGTPADGQVFSLLVDDTNGVEWLFRYDSAKTLWRAIGGPPFTAEVDTSNSVTTTSYADVGGASLTLPSVGTSFDVDIFHGATTFFSTNTIFTSLSIAGSTPVDTDSANGGALAHSASVARKIATRNIASGSVIKQEYKLNASGSGSESGSWIAVYPRQLHP